MPSKMVKNIKYFENCRSLYHFRSDFARFFVWQFKIHQWSTNSFKYTVDQTEHCFKSMIEAFNSGIALSERTIVMCICMHKSEIAIAWDGGSYSDGVFILDRRTDKIYQIDIECNSFMMRIKIINNVLIVDNTREYNFYRIIEEETMLRIVKIFSIPCAGMGYDFIVREKLVFICSERYYVFNIEEDIDEEDCGQYSEIPEFKRVDLFSESFIKLRDPKTINGYANVIVKLSSKCYKEYEAPNKISLSEIKYVGENIFVNNSGAYKFTSDYEFVVLDRDIKIIGNNIFHTIFDKNNNMIYGQRKDQYCRSMIKDISRLNSHVIGVCDNGEIKFFVNDKLIRSDDCFSKVKYFNGPHEEMVCRSFPSPVIKTNLIKFLIELIDNISRDAIGLIIEYC